MGRVIVTQPSLDPFTLMMDSTVCSRYESPQDKSKQRKTSSLKSKAVQLRKIALTSGLISLSLSSPPGWSKDRNLTDRSEKFDVILLICLTIHKIF